MTVRKIVVLEERIAEAFVVGAKSTAVRSLIDDVEAAALAAGAAANLARERALEPTLSIADVAAARREMEDAAFRRDRMQVALTKLRVRLTELENQEEEQRRWAAYDAAIAKRDELAAKFKELYPAFATQVADLLARIEASDSEIERINTRGKPAGAERIAGAEEVARDLNGYIDGVRNIPRITRDLRLPAFEYRGNEDYAWPR